MPANDDQLIYELSRGPAKNINATMIQMKYKFTNEYSQKLKAAALSMRSHKRKKTDYWKLISKYNPPCFVDLLFSDGESVVAGRIESLYDTKKGFDPADSLMQLQLKRPLTWWRHVPEGPREYYGFDK